MNTLLLISILSYLLTKHNPLFPQFFLFNVKNCHFYHFSRFFHYFSTTHSLYLCFHFVFSTPATIFPNFCSKTLEIHKFFCIIKFKLNCEYSLQGSVESFIYVQQMPVEAFFGGQKPSPLDHQSTRFAQNLRPTIKTMLQ